MNKEIFLLNFGIELNDGILREIEERSQCKVNVFNVGVKINLKKNVYIQIVDLINEVPEKFLYSKELIINVPTLSLAAIYIFCEIYFKTNRMPFVLELHRDKSKNPFAEFEFGKICNLQLEKSVTQNNQKIRQLNQ
jgi:hypothetical protein